MATPTPIAEGGGDQPSTSQPSHTDDLKRINNAQLSWMAQAEAEVSLVPIRRAGIRKQPPCSPQKGAQTSERKFAPPPSAPPRRECGQRS